MQKKKNKEIKRCHQQTINVSEEGIKYVARITHYVGRHLEEKIEIPDDHIEQSVYIWLGGIYLLKTKCGIDPTKDTTKLNILCKQFQNRLGFDWQ